MEIYKNLNGKSGIVFYELKPDAILVKFSGNLKTYVYSHSSAGSANVNSMKTLAINGTGLNSFIMNNARLLYER